MINTKLIPKHAPGGSMLSRIAKNFVEYFSKSAKTAGKVVREVPAKPGIIPVEVKPTKNIVKTVEEAIPESALIGINGPLDASQMFHKVVTEVKNPNYLDDFRGFNLSKHKQNLQRAYSYMRQRKAFPENGWNDLTSPTSSKKWVFNPNDFSYSCEGKRAIFDESKGVWLITEL